MIPLVRSLIRRFSGHRVLSQSAQLAFYLLLSFFPCLIILTRFAGHQAVLDTLLGILSTLLPSAAADLVRENLSLIGQTPLLPTGIVLLVYAASRGITTLLYAASTAYSLPETRPFFLRFLLRFLLLPAILLLGIAAAVFLLILGQLFPPFRTFLREPLSLVIGSGGFAALFYLLPPKRIPFRRHLIGAFFAAAAGIVSSRVFAIFTEFSQTYSAYYGNISGVIMLLLWLYLTSAVIILGMELNAAIYEKEETSDEHHRSASND